MYWFMANLDIVEQKSVFVTSEVVQCLAVVPKSYAGKAWSNYWLFCSQNFILFQIYAAER